ncbi:MAG: hypothetical protein GY853_06270 [PVC group bacterium]|nr:hypothetical protein [PVC group bacterium]
MESKGVVAGNPKPGIVQELQEAIKKQLKAISLQKVIKTIIVCGVIITAYFVFDLFYQKLKKEKRFVAITKNIATEKGQTIDASFLLVIKKNLESGIRYNIFGLIPGKQAKIISEKKANWVKEAEARMKQLSFVGVWWETDVPQVILEDTITRETHLLQQGQMFETFTVKTIKEDSVVLQKENKEWEI